MLHRTLLLGALAAIGVGLLPPLFVQAQSLHAQNSTNTQEPPSTTPLPALPAGCQPIQVVGGQGTEVTKRVGPPGLPIPIPLGGLRTRDDYNTDWVVPTNATYNRFVVILMPRNNGQYGVAMYLKYPDDTADKIYNNTDQLVRDQPIVVEGRPRANLQPYQVNIRVGGPPESLGLVYTAIAGVCR